MLDHGFNLQTVAYSAPNAAARLTQSLRDTGFAVITDHPISIQDIDAAYDGWRDFFTSDDKTMFRAEPPHMDGFFPLRSENAKDAPIKDLKEFYHVYPGGQLPPAVTADTQRCYAQLVALGQTVLGWIADNCPSEVRNEFSEPLANMIRDSETNLLRVLHYPPLEEPLAEPGAVRAAAHEDINLITLLVAGSTPGLQAQDANGTWHDVPCNPGMITVNVGDMLQMASGGYFPSTTHRVVNPPRDHNVARYSVPMFLHPRPTVKLNDQYSADDYLQERLREIGLK